jgi:hypothetical protein
MKNSLQSEWELTDLGEPWKIIGIEITQTNDSITISAELYRDPSKKGNDGGR